MSTRRTGPRIQPAVAGTARVCAYDRAGQGWSEDAPQAQDGLAAADLHTLLDRAGEDGRYVLVGHSIGGDQTMTYAARHPEQVAGMVLLDTTPPYRTTAGGTAHAGPPGAVAVLPSLARLGIGRLLPTSVWSALPEPAAGQYAAFASSPRGWRNTVDETATLPALLTQAQALSTLGSTPLVVVTAAEHVTDPDWADAHSQMAGLSTSSSHREAGASHGGLLDEEHGADLSAHAVTDVVQAVRTGRWPAAAGGAAWTPLDPLGRWCARRHRTVPVTRMVLPAAGASPARPGQVSTPTPTPCPVGGAEDGVPSPANAVPANTAPLRVPLVLLATCAGRTASRAAGRAGRG
ncbi:alpha/beta fold hydrolase [Geodermatophilus sp. SYSU D00700]